MGHQKEVGWWKRTSGRFYGKLTVLRINSGDIMTPVRLTFGKGRLRFPVSKGHYYYQLWFPLPCNNSQRIKPIEKVKQWSWRINFGWWFISTQTDNMQSMRPPENMFQTFSTHEPSHGIGYTDQCPFIAFRQNDGRKPMALTVQSSLTKADVVETLFGFCPNRWTNCVWNITWLATFADSPFCCYCCSVFHPTGPLCSKLLKLASDTSPSRGGSDSKVWVW